jgi:hypothetical protein
MADGIAQLEIKQDEKNGREEQQEHQRNTDKRRRNGEQAAKGVVVEAVALPGNVEQGPDHENWFDAQERWQDETA